MSRQKFGLGLMFASANAQSRLAMVEIMIAIRRHSLGDWGEVCDEDHAANERALRVGARLLSVYRSWGGEKFWIITEADRSATTVLFPEDY